MTRPLRTIEEIRAADRAHNIAHRARRLAAGIVRLELSAPASARDHLRALAARARAGEAVTAGAAPVPAATPESAGAPVPAAPVDPETRRLAAFGAHIERTVETHPELRQVLNRAADTSASKFGAALRDMFATQPATSAVSPSDPELVSLTDAGRDVQTLSQRCPQLPAFHAACHRDGFVLAIAQFAADPLAPFPLLSKCLHAAPGHRLGERGAVIDAVAALARTDEAANDYASEMFSGDASNANTPPAAPEPAPARLVAAAAGIVNRFRPS